VAYCFNRRQPQSVDSIAHQTCLDAGGTTITVLPGPLNKIYASSHHNLDMRILEWGGALVSEYSSGTGIRNYQFIDRNRLITGLANAVIITEAAKKSGSLHTAQFALEQGIDVLAVPGNITSQTSVGTNNLLKVGASPVTSADDVLAVLGIAIATPVKATSDNRPGQSTRCQSVVLVLS
jgi:DNA processing protein